MHKLKNKRLTKMLDDKARQRISRREKRRFLKAYDKVFKRFFSNTRVLAGILKNVIPEYRELGIEEICTLIECDAHDTTHAKLLATELTNINDKTTYFDMLFNCILPNQKTRVPVQLVINLEMQMKLPTDYPILKRGIYYVSREIDAQMHKGSSYKDIRAVYSIWICIKGIPDVLQNTVRSYTIQLNSKNNDEHCTDSEKQEIADFEQGLDIFNLVFILLSENTKEEELMKLGEDKTLVKFLSSIFYDYMDNRKLNPYIAAEKEVSQEVSRMNALMEKHMEIFEYARLEGYNEGVDFGIEQGIEQGKAALILETLEELGSIPGSLKKTILSEHDPEILKKWNKAAVNAESIEEFEKNINV